MPFYRYFCTDCDHEETVLLKIGARDALVGTAHTLPEHCKGTLFRPPESPGFTSSESLGRVKAPSEFRDLLKAIKKENPRSNIKER